MKFNSAFAAYATGNTKLFALAVNRFRPGYCAAFDAWVATHPLKNPHAAPDPSDLPQYTIPEQLHGQALDVRADAQFKEGESAAGTADKYVRLTVFLAAILFLIGISSHFLVRAARYWADGHRVRAARALARATRRPARAARLSHRQEISMIAPRTTSASPTTNAPTRAIRPPLRLSQALKRCTRVAVASGEIA